MTHAEYVIAAYVFTLVILGLLTAVTLWQGKND